MQDIQKRLPPQLAERVDRSQRRLQERLGGADIRAQLDGLTQRLDALTLKVEGLEKLVAPTSGSAPPGPLGPAAAQMEPSLAAQRRRPRPAPISSAGGRAGEGAGALTRRPRPRPEPLETPTENQVVRPPASRRKPAGTPPSASAETSAESQSSPGLDASLEAGPSES
ncbi:MAG: hypothetical protein DLM66_03815 [Candidatus Dormiibacter spiritus]|nr:MAG: hypothetical protein DLM66_03815 [Candidatus Dormibacteraeota bacterium]